MRVPTGVFLFVTALSAVFPAAAEDIYPIGGDVSAPKLIHKVELRYPKRAKKAKLKGRVVLSAVLSSSGKPEKIEVVKSLDADLDAAAVKTVSQWQFKPAERNGKPVAVRIEIQVNFRLCCSWF